MKRFLPTLVIEKNQSSEIPFFPYIGKEQKVW